VRNVHRIRVLGREIQVRSSSSPTAVHEIEAFVNDKLAEVASSVPAADQQLVTILALLDVSESLLAGSRPPAVELQQIRVRMDGMLKKLDQALG
jgi:cell division protein ZapA